MPILLFLTRVRGISSVRKSLKNRAFLLSFIFSIVSKLLEESCPLIYEANEFSMMGRFCDDSFYFKNAKTIILIQTHTLLFDYIIL